MGSKRDSAPACSTAPPITTKALDRPFEFNIGRDPNPHLGFGGNGAHYCIGANLARMEIKLIFNEIADQIPNIAKLSEPQRLRSGGSTG